MQPTLLILTLLTTTLNLVSAQPLRLKQRDDSDVTVSLGPIRGDVDLEGLFARDLEAKVEDGLLDLDVSVRIDENKVTCRHRSAAP
jgi:hypothetical protein